MGGFLFCLPYSSIRLEGQCVYLSQARSRGFGAAQSIGVPVSQYIDDRHMGQLFTAPLQLTRGPSFQQALAAAYIMCYLLIEAGYFIGLDKSQSSPSTSVCFLGSCVTRCVKLFSSPPPPPPKKKIKFATLREDVLSSPFVSQKILQRFAGKVISFSLLFRVPNCKFFMAISRHSGSSRLTVKLEANHRAGIEYWWFLDDWKD